MSHQVVPLSGRAHLAGTYVPGTSAPDFALLWVHGFGSHRGGEKSEAVQQECARRGWTFAAFDFRAHGESSGTMAELTPALLLEDLAAIRMWLAARGHTRLGLVGSSMGGFASAWFAKDNRKAVVGCVFVAPGFGFLDRRWNALTDEDRAAWARTGRMRFRNEWLDIELGYELVAEREQYTPLALLTGWRTPALLFHGLADDVVPYTDSLYFIENVGYAHVELRLLQDGDHRLAVYKREIATAAGTFFANLLE